MHFDGITDVSGVSQTQSLVQDLALADGYLDCYLPVFRLAGLR